MEALEINELLEAEISSTEILVALGMVYFLYVVIKNIKK